MIFVGLDDTDTLDTAGTNQLARALAERVAAAYSCRLIVRHQLLVDPRVPYTSHNGSASLLLQPRGPENIPALVRELRAGVRERFVPGSDPGICVAGTVPAAVMDFGRRCQGAVVTQEEARALAAAAEISLEGLGGTEGGVIGALAAVGLLAGSDDGRVVRLGSFSDELSGPQPWAALVARGVLVRRLDTDTEVRSGTVDVGKKLRPNYRAGAVVLYVEPVDLPGLDWRAVRLP